MKINNPAAKKAIAEAMKQSEFDCADWEIDTLEELALEILVYLGARGIFVVTI